MTDHSTLRIDYIDPTELNPAAYNPRSISDEALRRLARLLDAHGFVDPMIARAEDKLVIGGHQRLKANALRATPDATVPVVLLTGVSDAHARALNVALNNTEAQGEFDTDRLATLLADIDTEGLAVPDLTGLTADSVAGLLGELEDMAPEPRIPEAHQVVVECDDEDHQRRVYEQFVSEGRTCRLLTL